MLLDEKAAELFTAFVETLNYVDDPELDPQAALGEAWLLLGAFAEHIGPELFGIANIGGRIEHIRNELQKYYQSKEHSAGGSLAMKLGDRSSKLQPA